MHASIGPRIITHNRSPWSVLPRQRIRIGTLVRRETVRRESRRKGYRLAVYAKSLLSADLLVPACIHNRCANDKRHCLLSLSHSYVCALRGDRDGSLGPVNYTAIALRIIPSARGIVLHANAAHIHPCVTSVVVKIDL